MKKRIVAILCITALLLNCALAYAAPKGFDYSKLKVDGMLTVDGTDYLHGDAYIYSFSEEDDGWSCGVMTTGEPYLLLLAQGSLDGEETYIMIEVAFDLKDNTKSATAVEFVADGYAHTLELTEAAQVSGLEGFPIHKDNYGIIEAFAKAETLSASAYIDDDTFEVELSEEAVDVIRNMADTLVSQGAIDHYNPTFSQPSNLKQMNALIVYTTAPSAEQTAHLHPDSDEVAPVVEPDIDKTYFVANSDIIMLVEYGHTEKNAFEGDGFYNDALYCLLAMQMIVDGSDERDLYGLSIFDFAASEDDGGVMFAIPQTDHYFIMRINYDTYVIEMYDLNEDPEAYSDENILRLIAYENGYTGFSSRPISKDVVDFVLSD